MSDPQDLPDDGRASAAQSALVVEELIAANNESNRTMLSLVERVREETAARDRKVDVLERGHQQMRWVIGLAVALVLVMLGFGIVNAVNLSATRTTNRTLLDCVNSTGACGRANSAAQAEILNTVKLYELTVMYCARTNPRDVDANGDKFIACVNELYPGAPQLDRHGE